MAKSRLTSRPPASPSAILRAIGVPVDYIDDAAAQLEVAIREVLEAVVRSGVDVPEGFGERLAQAAARRARSALGELASRAYQAGHARGTEDAGAPIDLLTRAHAAAAALVHDAGERRPPTLAEYKRALWKASAGLTDEDLRAFARATRLPLTEDGT